MNWQEILTEREYKELQFARVYATEYGHGTDGHNRLLLIAKLAGIAEGIYTSINQAVKESVEHLSVEEYSQV